MADSIFTSQVPAVLDANDATAYTLGTKWSASVAGEVTAGRWYFPGTVPGGTVNWVLYDVASQTLLARQAFSSTAPGWQTVALGTPVSYPTPGVEWVAAVETPDHYVATTNFFTGNVTSGVLVAPADANNGRLGVGSVYPAMTFSDSCYFADLVFAPAGSPAQGSAAAGLALTVAAAGHRSSAGLATAGLTLTLAAHGYRPSSGVVDLDLAVAVVPGGSGGRPFIARPDAGTTTRPDTGTVRRPNTGLVHRP